MINILFLILGFELSYANGYQYMYEPTEFNEIESTWDVSFNIKAIVYEYFYAKGSVKIPVYPLENGTFNPVALSSFFELGVLIGGLTVGWRHFCTHPVAPFYTGESFLRFYDESGSELFIRFDTEKIKIF